MAGMQVKKTGSLELLVLFIYLGLLAVVLYFHEPWFDEAQSWLIARDASLMEMLTKVTHYEGHPPFWWFVLTPLAKLNVPYELGLKMINFLFAGSAMGILIYKAPFPRLIRLVLPFSYFFFYQYGVISRPYSMMMLGFVLSAWTYKRRNEMPMRFVLSLALIGCSSAYGILITGGIAIAWFWEIIHNGPGKRRLRDLLYDRRFHLLLGLFIFYFMIYWLIRPFPDTHGSNVAQANSYFQRLLYMFLIAPGDAVCSASYFDDTINIGLNLSTMIGFLFGLLINLTLLLYTKLHHKILLWILPYGLLAVFAGSVYFSGHHLGVITLFYLFILWSCTAEPSAERHQPSRLTQVFENHRARKLLRSTGYLLLIIAFGISVFWSFSSVVLDMARPYGDGRAVASFLKSTKLAELDILVEWMVRSDKKTGQKISDYNMVYGVQTLPYFDHNLYMNLNPDTEISYLTHQIDTDGAELKARLADRIPDVLIGMPDLKAIYGTTITLKDYVLVQKIPANTIWKGEAHENYTFIFLRRDLLTAFPALKEESILIS